MKAGPLSFDFGSGGVDAPPLPAAASMAPAWRPYGPYARQCESSKSTVAKLLVHGVPGYLAWCCTGPGAGYRGRDVGHWLDGCWSSFNEAAAALREAQAMPP